MKRQSKAEEALKAQRNMIDGEIQGLHTIINECQAKISALTGIKFKIEDEINRLYKIRLVASEKVKP